MRHAAAGSIPEPNIPGGSGAVANVRKRRWPALLRGRLGHRPDLLFHRQAPVRFHAAQSIVTFGGLQILSIVIGWTFGFSLFTGAFGVFSLGYAVYGLVQLVAIVLWIVLMIKAYQHNRFRVPIAADLAEKIFGKF